MEWSDQRHRAVEPAPQRDRPCGVAADTLARPPRRLHPRRYLAQGAADLAVRQRGRGRVARRQPEQLGNYTGELREPHAARALDDPSSWPAWRRPAPWSTRLCPSASRTRRSTMASMPSSARSAIRGWPAIYVRLELGLLQELGFGLDLEKCAADRHDGGSGLRLAQDRPCGVARGGRALSRQADRPAGLSIHRRSAGRCRRSCGKAST